MRNAIDFIKEGNEGYDFRTIVDNIDESDIIDCMVEFAKMHVTEALKKASKEATAGDENMYYSSLIDKDSILNSYSLADIT
jgi:hypothetical protein